VVSKSFYQGPGHQGENHAEAISRPEENPQSTDGELAAREDEGLLGELLAAEGVPLVMWCWTGSLLFEIFWRWGSFGVLAVDISTPCNKKSEFPSVLEFLWVLEETFLGPRDRCIITSSGITETQSN
jgi:hypothetical protein